LIFGPTFSLALSLRFLLSSLPLYVQCLWRQNLAFSWAPAVNIKLYHSSPSSSSACFLSPKMCLTYRAFVFRLSLSLYSFDRLIVLKFRTLLCITIRPCFLSAVALHRVLISPSHLHPRLSAPVAIHYFNSFPQCSSHRKKELHITYTHSFLSSCYRFLNHVCSI
jgi:hypothetical protein